MRSACTDTLAIFGVIGLGLISLAVAAFGATHDALTLSATALGILGGYVQRRTQPSEQHPPKADPNVSPPDTE
jgi:uncharacterized membrane protein